MVISEDKTRYFLPKKTPQFVILGTMVAICARTLNGEKPTEKTFYYHNNRNHFWRVLQHLLEGELISNQLSIPEKKALLEKHGVAICNLVSRIEVPNSEAHDPADTILFKAHRRNRLDFRRLDGKMKGVIESTPCFFTCRHKKGIENLVNGFWDKNKLKPEAKENIWYLPTPTRCNPKDRSLIWAQEMREHRLALKI